MCMKVEYVQMNYFSKACLVCILFLWGRWHHIAWWHRMKRATASEGEAPDCPLLAAPYANEKSRYTGRHHLDPATCHSISIGHCSWQWWQECLLSSTTLQRLAPIAHCSHLKELFSSTFRCDCSKILEAQFKVPQKEVSKRSLITFSYSVTVWSLFLTILSLFLPFFNWTPLPDSFCGSEQQRHYHWRRNY